jgi:integrase
VRATSTETGIKRVRLHDLRHVQATLLLKAGVPVHWRLGSGTAMRP